MNQVLLVAVIIKPAPKNPFDISAKAMNYPRKVEVLRTHGNLVVLVGSALARSKRFAYVSLRCHTASTHCPPGG